MRYEAKTVILKDGTTALFRSPEPEDAAAFLDFFNTVRAETDFLLSSALDPAPTLEEERARIESSLDSPAQLTIAREMDGIIAGNCQLALKPNAKNRHRASLAIALRRAYWGRGIGTAMFTELIAAARAHGVTQLELDYIEGNDRGKALYEKMGFQPWGELPDGVRQPDGSMRSLIYMRLALEQGHVI